MSIGTTAIELRVFKKKKKKKNMDKMGKTFLGIIFTFGALLLRFLVYCLVFTYKVPLKVKNDLKVKARSEFPNVWGEYKIPWQSLYTGYYRTL